MGIKHMSICLSLHRLSGGLDSCETLSTHKMHATNVEPRLACMREPLTICASSPIMSTIFQPCGLDDQQPNRSVRSPRDVASHSCCEFVRPSFLMLNTGVRSSSMEALEAHHLSQLSRTFLLLTKSVQMSCSNPMDGIEI